MDFLEVIEQARNDLQHKGRISYRALKMAFTLDDEQLAVLKEELIDILEVAADKDGKMLVWIGGEIPEQLTSPAAEVPTVESLSPVPSPQPEQETPTGERRQLTVMFCDLVGSTALSEHLDPEELQTVVQTYQEVSAQVIERYEGYIAQYLGDGLLVYFGYPAAHEDDAARAIRAGLEIVTALEQARSQFPQPVHVRIGIHTGLVVVGTMGGGSRHEQLALGETPNIAARVQGQAAPDQVVISAATQQLVAGLFETEDQGRHELKGISSPQPLYRVTAESVAQSRFAVAVQAGLTPLAGREQELGVLRERWTLAQAGSGQVVLLSGEPGIGKSRLVQELKDQATQDGATSIQFQCSPYHQNSAFYPVITHLQRLLQFERDETAEAKLAKLQQLLDRYRFPQADTLPLLAALLSLPHPEGVPAVTGSPQQQKEQTHAALVAWLLEETEQQPVYTPWEDLHWADPSTLEVLDLMLRQVPTVRLFAALTFRPEFVPPWSAQSYLSHLTLRRLGQAQVSVMVEQVTGGKALPEEVVEQIVTKTDGVPLFVEELTKMVMESSFVREENGQYTLTGPLPPLAIPSTLQDSLMARLDRVVTVREVAQLGATIGREFSYELLQAVSPLDEETLQQGLQQLVDAELVYQRGLPPQARYTFKHALIQDTAYESLLKSRRQQFHQQVADILAQQFSEIVQTQPELVAHHYTEAGLVEQALPYWQQAGDNAIARSANVEAVNYLTSALELLKTLPASAERSQQELDLQMLLGPAFIVTRGNAAPAVEQTYRRAQELCHELGETRQLFPALFGLRSFYFVQGEFQTAHEMGTQLLRTAQHEHDPDQLLEAHVALATSSLLLGKFPACRAHGEEGMALYTPQHHHAHVALYGIDPGVICLNRTMHALWHLGYPDQAVRHLDKSLRLARELEHPFSLVFCLSNALMLHSWRREPAALLD